MIYLDQYELSQKRLISHYSKNYSYDHLHAESTQANNHTIITVYNNHLSNATSNHFSLPNAKKPV